MSQANNFLDGKSKSSEIDSFLGPDTPPQASAARKLGDLGLSLAKGVVAVPEAAVGLADLVSGGRAGKAAEDIGIRFKDAKDVLSSFQSDDFKGKQQQFQQADGLLDKAGVAVSNPSLITNAVAESLPLMGVGGVGARGVLAMAPKVGAVGAGAIGEGLAGAGSAAEGIRQETNDGLLTGKQAALAGASGAATAAFGAAGGKAAKALGIGDVDTMIARGATDVAQTAAQANKGVIRRGAEGFLSEGVLEELPQSLSEQILQNEALGKPWQEGLDDAAVMAVLTGGAMGAGAGALTGRQTPPPPPPGPDLSLDPGQLAAVQSEEMGTPNVPQTTPPDGRAALNAQQEQQRQQREAQLAAQRAVSSPDDEIFASTGALEPVKPSAQMGINPAAGVISAVAAQAVDTGQTQEIELAQADAQDQAAYEQAMDAQEQQAAEQDSADKPITSGPIAEAQMSEEDKRAVLFSNQAVADGGRKWTGTQDGDILNGMAAPFATRMAAARRANMEGKDWTIAPVFDGWVARRKDAFNVSDSNGVQPAPTASSGNDGNNAGTGVESGATDGNGLGADTGGREADTLVQPGESAGGVDAAPVANDSQAEAAPDQAPEAVGSDAAAATELPGAGSTNLQADGVKAGATGTQLAKVPQLKVTFGGQSYPVDSINDAQDKWVAFRDETGAGVSEIGNGVPITDQDGKLISRISYNGRAWDSDAYNANLMAEAPGSSTLTPKEIQEPTKQLPGPASLGSAKADMDHLFGVDAKRTKALDRIAKGTAYFGTNLKAAKFIADNGLKDTHEWVKTGASRFEVREKATTQEALQVPSERETRIASELANGGHVVGADLRDRTGMRLMGLTPEELKTIPADKVRAKPSAEAARTNSTTKGNEDGTQAAQAQPQQTQPEAGADPGVSEPAAGAGVGGATEGVEEPNFQAAKNLLAQQKASTGNAVAEGAIRKKLRDLAAKTPISDAKTVSALDIAATRLGMGEGKLKGLEFAPAAAPVSNTQTADATATPAQADRAKKNEGLHMATGRADFEAGKPRTLPSYYIKPGDKNSKDWYRGWDAANAAAPAKGLGEQLAELNAELERQGPVQNANTRAQRDAIRKQIAQEDFPGILKAVDDNIDVAEELNSAFKYAGDEPKAKTIARILKKRGITPEYQARWTERLMDGWNEKPGTVNVPPTVAEAFTAQMQKQKGRITRLKNEADKAGSLEDKKVAQVKVAEAESMLRKMRLRIFDAEDAAIKAVKSGDTSAFDAFADTFPDAKQAIAKLTGQNDELDAEMQSYEAKPNPTYSGEPAVRQKLETIAGRLGFSVNKSKTGWHASGTMLSIPTEDADLSSAVSADHVFAHEIGHGVMSKRGVSVKGFPDVELRKRVSNWDELVAASKAFRPGVHNHASDSARKHAKKANEIVADAIASVLIGDKPLTMLQPLMDWLGINKVDLGLQTVEESNAEYRAKNPSNARSDSPAVQDFIDGKRPDAPTIEEVKAEQKTEPKAPQAPATPAPVATETVATPDAKAALSEREKAAKAKMFNALGKLATLAGKNTRMNWTQEEEQQLLPIVIELFDGAMELGAVSFQQAVAYVREFIASGLDQETADAIPFDTLQGAYISVAGRHKDKAVTSKKEVVGFESLEELNQPAPDAVNLDSLEKPAEIADTGTEETQNEPTNPSQQDPQALDGVPTAKNSGAKGGRGVGRGGSGRGTRSKPSDSGLAEPGVSGTRSGGSGSTTVRAPTARKPHGGRLGDTGTGANGSGLPEERSPEPVDLFNQPTEPVSVGNIQASNFRITEDVRLGQGGEAEKFRDNLAAIRTLKAIEAEGRRATSEEQRTLARYVGWGGLASAFPNPETKEWKDDWKARGAELKDLLTQKEYDLARRSTLDSHYTSQTVVTAMWDAARRLGFKGGLAAETSMGIGNFIGLMPEAVAGNTRFIGVEYDSLTARMAGLLYPQSTVLHSGLQKVPLSDNAFDLNIGNPPFGDQSLRFQFKPEFNRVSIHNQFFLAGVDSLKPGGLQLNVVSRYLLDAMDKTTRTMLAKRAKLVAAIRLPDTAFKENARTSVVTDIVVLQRLTPAEEINMQAVFEAANSKPEKDFKAEAERKALAAQVPDWVEVGKMADPLGGDAMTVNSYFVQNPDMILGTLERSGKMQFKNDITVRPGAADLSELLAKAVAKLPEGIMNRTQEAIDESIARHKTMGDALKIALSGQEAGSIALNPDGVLEQVIERETPEGDYELAKRPLTADAPWSESLFQDAKGNWFTVEAKKDADGNNLKVMKAGKDGKLEATKANVYERVVYKTEAEIPSSKRLGEKNLDRLTSLVKLRDLMITQINLETEDAPTLRMEGNRTKLREAYQAFTAAHGFISKPTNSALVANMPDGALVQALELSYRKAITLDKAKKMGEKPRPEQADPAPILTERVIPKYEPPTAAASPADALSIVLSETGRVDIARMASLLGKTEEAVTAEMFDQSDKPLIFKDPETQQWVTRNDYLTGQVKKKLHAAQAAGLDKHIRELEAVLPEAWGAENVTVLLGATFVPPQIYADFVQHMTGRPATVSYSQATNSYAVKGQPATTEKQDEFGAEGITIAEMISDMLNSSAIKVMTKDADGNSVVDRERTDLAILKSRQIATEFTDWAFADSARRKTLVDLFNEKYNTRVNRQHDGSHLTLPGKVPDAILKMRRHQKNTIWRGISERFMLIDHVVGAGKTFTAIARAMERRRMGLSRKPAIIVPNHMVEQFKADVYRLYPGAKVLAAGKNDFEKKRRRKVFAKIASGDWDIVIIPHSSFGFIGIAPETEERYLEQELATAEQAIKDAWDESDEAPGSFRKPFNVKQAERLRDKITARMERLRGDKSKDRLLTFEQMGIDDLTVDEAHEFKNLFYSTKLTGVKGMGNPSGSQKAFDLYTKVRVLRESPTGTVTFMTGTPISNSAVEMFNMMRYLAADELKELGLEHFDAWRAQFVSTDSGWEPNETGRLKEVNRLGRSWSNMRSLMDLYYSFTDSVGNDDIKSAYAEDNPGKEFPIPKVMGGDRQSVVVKPTPEQIALLEQTIADFDSLPSIEDPYDRNIERLKLMDRARKVSLDVRAAVRGHPSKEAGGKLEKISAEVKRIYDKWTDDKGTQLIFLDRSVPKFKGDDKVLKEYDALVADRNAALNAEDENALRKVSDKLEKFDSEEMEAMRAAQAGGWNAYQQIKDNLIASGIPAGEIRFIQEATNDAQKQALFDQVKAGEVRVLIGSTPRMGAGTNVQDRLVGLHHADVTWKPSDIEQREGRIIRQGNKLLEKYGIDKFEVEILAYATERTIDAKMWNLNSAKLKTINAIRNYDGSFSMDFDDDDSVSMAELAALASGNPLLLERVKLDSEINNLELLRKQHQRKTWGFKGRLEDAENAIKSAGPDSERYGKLAEQARQGVDALEKDLADRSVMVEGKTFSAYGEAAKAVAESIKQQQGGDENAKFSVKIGERRLTSQAGALEALSDALGDSAPFLATANGTTYRGRTALSRDIGKLANEAAPNMAHRDAKVLVSGKMLGFTFEATLNYGSFTGYSIDLALVDSNGRTVYAEETRRQQDGKFVTSSVTGPLGKLSESVNPSTFESNARFALQAAERAKKEIPELREKAALPFAKDGELKEKQARLAQVISELSSDKAPESALDATPDADPAAFSRPTFSRGAQSQANESVERLATGIASHWENAPKVVVAFDMNDPVIPENVRKEDQRQRSGGAKGTPEGFYYKGTVYLMSSKLGTPNDIARVLFHEALGHYGLRGTFGKALRPILRDVAMLRRAEVDAKIKQYGLKMGNTLDRFTAAEEVLAELAQTKPEIGFVQRAIAAIRTWLRQNVPGFNNMRLTDDELIRNYILPARRYVEQGGGPKGGLPVRVEPTFSRGADQTQREAFKKWFGDSKVVTADGKPRVMYHGTADRINVFKSGAYRGGTISFAFEEDIAAEYAAGAIFNQREKARKSGEAFTKEPVVEQVYLSIQKPFDGGVSEHVDSVVKILERQGVKAPAGFDWAKILKMSQDADLETTEIVSAMKEAGFDGQYVRDAGRTILNVFDPAQIKSATGNNGDFDSENPDIRFSRTIGEAVSTAANNIHDVSLPAGYTVGDMLKSAPGKLNWWHKTVGTMYNLAERSPAFKRVFDGAQSFINDVSYYATEAADLAPTILPKLETWKDIAKSPLSPEDTKAISAPIFEGTLTWARDESGKPIKMVDLESQAAALTPEQKAQRLLRNNKVSDQVLKMWQGLPIEQFESIIEGKYEREMLKAGVVWSPAELQSMFKLTGKQNTDGKWDGQIGLYQEFRTATDKSLTNLAISDMLRFGGKDTAPIREEVLAAKSVTEASEVLRDYLLRLAEFDPERETVLIDTANKMIDKGTKAQDLIDRGYAPLSRYGQYTLDVVSAEGERVYFSMFESRMDAARARRNMEQEYPGATITQGTVSEEEYKLFSGVSPETLELFGDMLGLEAQGDSASAQAFQTYLKLAKSNRSSMKRLIQRKGIAGFNEDAGRVLAGFVYSNARQTSSNLHMGSLSDAANTVAKQQGELKDQAVRLVDYIKNPREEAQALRGLLFAQYIGGSVASAMVNMTQPLTMTFPWLSQYGGVTTAAKQMAAAVKDSNKKLTGDARLDAALKRAEEDGTVSPQEVHQLMQQSQGKGALQSGDGTKLGNAAAAANNTLSRISVGWGKLFSLAEQFNRRVTFIAAYRTAVAQGMADPDGFARKAIAETQGIYNKGNKPAWARGAVGSVLFTFKQYSIAYVEMLHRMGTQGGPEGKKAALLALGVLFLMGGAGGMPGADDLDDLISGILQRLGYNFDSKQKRKEFFASIVGEGGAQFLERGISGLPGVPLDVSGRMGMGNLLPGTGLLTKKTDYTRDVTEIAGPAGDFVKRGFNAAGKVLEGEVGGAQGAVATMAPKAAQNLFQAYDMANMGMYRDAKGMKVLDTDGGDAVLKAIGFQPNDVKKVQDASFDAQRMIGLNKLRETEIANRWAQGIFEKDTYKVKAAREELAEWNATNADSPIRINFKQILQRVQKMNQSRAERITATAPKEIRADVRRALEVQ